MSNDKQECLSALCRASFVDVYIAYLRSYGHLKIVKWPFENHKMYRNVLKIHFYKLARTPWKMYPSA